MPAREGRGVAHMHTKRLQAANKTHTHTLTREKNTKKKTPDRAARPEETIEAQDYRLKKDKKDVDRHFTEEGRVAEITIDLGISGKRQDGRKQVNGPEDQKTPL